MIFRFRSIAVPLVFALSILAGCDESEEPGTTLTSDGDAAGDTTLCCDANDNCSPAPPAPGVCPADTITTVCDEDNNCVDEDLD